MFQSGGKKQDSTAQQQLPIEKRDLREENEFCNSQQSTPKKHQDCDTESDTTADYESAGDASPWEKPPNVSALADYLAGVHLSTPDKIHTHLTTFPFSPISAEDECDDEVTAIISNASQSSSQTLSFNEKEEILKKEDTTMSSDLVNTSFTDLEEFHNSKPCKRHSQVSISTTSLLSESGQLIADINSLTDETDLCKDGEVNVKSSLDISGSNEIVKIKSYAETATEQVYEQVDEILTNNENDSLDFNIDSSSIQSVEGNIANSASDEYIPNHSLLQTSLTVSQDNVLPPKFKFIGATKEITCKTSNDSFNSTKHKIDTLFSPTREVTPSLISETKQQIDNLFNSSIRFSGCNSCSPSSNGSMNILESKECDNENELDSLNQSNDVTQTRTQSLVAKTKQKIDNLFEVKTPKKGVSSLEVCAKTSTENSIQDCSRNNYSPTTEEITEINLPKRSSIRTLEESMSPKSVLNKFKLSEDNVIKTAKQKIDTIFKSISPTKVRDTNEYCRIKDSNSLISTSNESELNKSNFFSQSILENDVELIEDISCVTENDLRNEIKKNEGVCFISENGMRYEVEVTNNISSSTGRELSKKVDIIEDISSITENKLRNEVEIIEDARSITENTLRNEVEISEVVISPTEKQLKNKVETIEDVNSLITENKFKNEREAIDEAISSRKNMAQDISNQDKMSSNEYCRINDSNSSILISNESEFNKSSFLSQRSILENEIEIIEDVSSVNENKLRNEIEDVCFISETRMRNEVEITNDVSSSTGRESSKKVDIIEDICSIAEKKLRNEIKIIEIVSSPTEKQLRNEVETIEEVNSLITENKFKNEGEAIDEANSSRKNMAQVSQPDVIALYSTTTPIICRDSPEQEINSEITLETLNITEFEQKESFITNISESSLINKSVVTYAEKCATSDLKTSENILENIIKTEPLYNASDLESFKQSAPFSEVSQSNSMELGIKEATKDEEPFNCNEKSKLSNAKSSETQMDSTNCHDILIEKTISDGDCQNICEINPKISEINTGIDFKEHNEKENLAPCVILPVELNNISKECSDVGEVIDEKEQGIQSFTVQGVGGNSQITNNHDLKNALLQSHSELNVKNPHNEISTMEVEDQCQFVVTTLPAKSEKNTSIIFSDVEQNIDKSAETVAITEEIVDTSAPYIMSVAETVAMETGERNQDMLYLSATEVQGTSKTSFDSFDEKKDEIKDEVDRIVESKQENQDTSTLSLQNSQRELPNISNNVVNQNAYEEQGTNKNIATVIIEKEIENPSNNSLISGFSTEQSAISQLEPHNSTDSSSVFAESTNISHHSIKDELVMPKSDQIQTDIQIFREVPLKGDLYISSNFVTENVEALQKSIDIHGKESEKQKLSSEVVSDFSNIYKENLYVSPEEGSGKLSCLIIQNRETQLKEEDLLPQNDEIGKQVSRSQMISNTDTNYVSVLGQKALNEIVAGDQCAVVESSNKQTNIELLKYVAKNDYICNIEFEQASSEIKQYNIANQSTDSLNTEKETNITESVCSNQSKIISKNISKVIKTNVETIQSESEPQFKTALCKEVEDNSLNKEIFNDEFELLSNHLQPSVSFSNGTPSMTADSNKIIMSTKVKDQVLLNNENYCNNKSITEHTEEKASLKAETNDKLVHLTNSKSAIMIKSSQDCSSNSCENVNEALSNHALSLPVAYPTSSDSNLFIPSIEKSPEMSPTESDTKYKLFESSPSDLIRFSIPSGFSGQLLGNESNSSSAGIGMGQNPKNSIEISEKSVSKSNIKLPSPSKPIIHVQGEMTAKNGKFSNSFSKSGKDIQGSSVNKSSEELESSGLNESFKTFKLDDLSKLTIERKSYEDLLDRCLEQERLLGFDESIKEEADKLIKELANASSDSDTSSQPCDLPTGNVNNSEAGPATADEDLSKGDFFQDAVLFDFDYLSKIGKGKPGSRLVRESLFLRFDPLAAPGAVELTPEQSEMAHADSSCDAAFSTPPRAPLPNGDDKLVSITPREEAVCSPASSTVVTPPRAKPRPTSGSATPTLRHEILSKEISKLQDLMLRQECSYQEQIAACTEEVEQLREKVAELEATENQGDLQEKLTATTAETNKLRKELTEALESKKQFVMIMNEYEKTISQVVTMREDDKKKFKLEKEQICNERDDAVQHLQNMELAFNDVHQKYEKCKEAITCFKYNEEQYKISLEENKKTILQQKENYHKLKEHAAQKLEQANIEISEMKKAHQAELAKMVAVQRKMEISVKSLEESLEQKKREAAELTKICDDLITKVDP